MRKTCGDNRLLNVALSLLLALMLGLTGRLLWEPGRVNRAVLNSNSRIALEHIASQLSQTEGEAHHYLTLSELPEGVSPQEIAEQLNANPPVGPYADGRRRQYFVISPLEGEPEFRGYSAEPRPAPAKLEITVNEGGQETICGPWNESYPPAIL